MFYPTPTDGRYSNGLRCLNTFNIPYVFDFYVYVVYFSKFGIGVKTYNGPALAHFICTNVYWRDNVYADVIVLCFMCQVGA